MAQRCHRPFSIYAKGLSVRTATLLTMYGSQQATAYTPKARRIRFSPVSTSKTCVQRRNLD